MNRSNMTRVIIFLLMTSVAIFGGCGRKEVLPQIYEEVLEIPGITEEYELLFVADSHISLCDERDPDVKEKAAQRYEMFRSPLGKGADETFHNTMEYVRIEQPDLLILGGDIVDSAMWASIDFVTKELENTGVDWVYSMGNHDFEYGQEYYSQRAFEEYLPRLGKISKARDGYQIKDLGEFIIFLVDDESNKISEEAADALESMFNQDKPIILVTHVPIEPHLDQTLWQESINVWGADQDGNSRVLLGYHSCYPDENTARFLDLVFADGSPVQLVLAGHVHFYHRDGLDQRLIQVVTGAGFENEMVRVKVKPAVLK